MPDWARYKGQVSRRQDSLFNFYIEKCLKSFLKTKHKNVLLHCHYKSCGKYHGIFCDSSVRHKEITKVPKCIIQRCLYNKYIFQITSYKQTNKNPS